MTTSPHPTPIDSKWGRQKGHAQRMTCWVIIPLTFHCTWSSICLSALPRWLAGPCLFAVFYWAQLDPWCYMVISHSPNLSAFSFLPARCFWLKKSFPQAPLSFLRFLKQSATHFVSWINKIYFPVVRSLKSWGYLSVPPFESFRQESLWFFNGSDTPRPSLGLCHSNICLHISTAFVHCMCLSPVPHCGLLVSWRWFLMSSELSSRQEIFERCILFYCVFMCACTYMCAHRCPWTRRGCQTPGAGITGSCKSPDIGAGNQTQLPWKSSKLLNFLSRPGHDFY